MLAVTTFSPKGFEQYGRKCLEGLAEFFPGRVIAYYEEKPKDLPEKVELRDFASLDKFGPFLDRVKRHPGSDGFGPDGKYDFRYDAQKFCRKVFVQDAVFDEDEYVFWIDADTIVKKQIPPDFLINQFKGSHLCFLGRQGSYTETGFIGFHTLHNDFEGFRSRYLPYFTTGKIFSQLKGWHDCIAFDTARMKLGNNLTPKGMNYDPVMVMSALAPYLDHLKGNRKENPKKEAKLVWS